jgi:hypothetical protein
MYQKAIDPNEFLKQMKAKQAQEEASFLPYYKNVLKFHWWW